MREGVDVGIIGPQYGVLVAGTYLGTHLTYLGHRIRCRIPIYQGLVKLVEERTTPARSTLPALLAGKDAS